MKRIVRYGLVSAVLIVIYLCAYNIEADVPHEVSYNFPAPEEVAASKDRCKTRGLALNSRAALIIDNNTNTWLYDKNAMRRQPIASLTKLLTAMVYLDSDPDLDTTVYISNRDCFESARSHVYRGEGYKALDLLYISLIASDNRAARALATASGIPRLIFIEKMNDKAKSLGMMNTEVFEVTGLDERNVSTAADVAIMIKAAMQYPLIRKASEQYIYKCYVANKKRNKRFVSTNRMVKSRWEVLAGKTGFIRESDYCLATILRDNAGKEITVVVLGSPTNNVRFSVARKLALYGFKRAERISDGKQIAGR